MKTCKTCRHFNEEDNEITDDYVSCRLFYVERQSGVAFDMRKFHCNLYEETQNKLYDVEISVKINQTQIANHVIHGIYAKNEDDAREKVSKMLDTEIVIV